jgi:hypothetical protein
MNLLQKVAGTIRVAKSSLEGLFQRLSRRRVNSGKIFLSHGISMKEPLSRGFQLQNPAA